MQNIITPTTPTLDVIFGNGSEYLAIDTRPLICRAVNVIGELSFASHEFLRNYWEGLPENVAEKSKALSDFMKGMAIDDEKHHRRVC